MKRFVFLICISLIIGISVSSCKKKSSDEPEVSSPLLTAIANLSDSAIANYQQLLVSNTPQLARRLLITKLRLNDSVKTAGLSADSATVWWQWNNGMYIHLLTETRSMGDTITKKFQVNETIPEPGTMITPKALVHNKRALILSPYQWDFSILGISCLTDETNFINSMLKKGNYTTSYLVNASKDQQMISLEDYKSWYNYGVVAIACHGGIGWNNNVFLASGVKITPQLFNRYQTELSNGTLYQVVYINKWFTKNIMCFGLTPAWFKSVYPVPIDSTLMYFGMCDGYYNSTLKKVLTGNGSDYFGWTFSVSSTQAAKTGKDMFTQFITGAMNCQNVYTTLEAHGNTTDNLPGGLVSKFNYFGDPTLRLVQKPIRIGATPADYDDIGKLLSTHGYTVRTIDLNYLSNKDTLANYDIIALNCAGGLDYIAGEAATALKDFVSNGGKLYASDWAYVFVQNAFPGYISFPANPKIGLSQSVTASINDAALITYLGTSSVDLVYDLGAWVVIDGTSQGNIIISGDVQTDTSTYLKGFAAHSKYNRPVFGPSKRRPLAVSFSYGSGKVLYTTFHNESQVSNAVESILEYFAILE